MSTDKESSVAVTDNRPPMLVESDYKSWKIHIERYIRGKPLGKLIWRSIQNGPTPHPQIIVTEGQGAAAVQSSSIVDPLAYLALTTHHLTPTQPNNPPPSTSSLTLPPQPAAQSSNDAMLVTMNQIMNLLSGFQKQFPPTNNQLRTSSNSRSHATMHDGQIVTETVQRKAPSNVGNTGTRGTQSYGQVTDNKGKLVICYNCRGEGHVSRQCKEKKRVKDSQYFKDKMLLMEAKEKRAVLDVEAEAFLSGVECTTSYDQPLAITTTNIFEVSHEDAYDSDVDEGP
nr:hypothetical protein [Tanacetum cinerariifolium]